MRVRIGGVILVSLLVELVGLLVVSVFTFLADNVVGAPVWLLASAGAVLAGVVKSVIEAATQHNSVQENGERGAGGPAHRPGVSAAAAIMVVLLVFGVGGTAAAAGIRYGVGWLSGNEDQIGAQRLVSPRSGKSGRVSVTVTGVVNTAHFTRVELSVTNRETKPATLSLFHNCVFTGSGIPLQADPFRSGWTEDVPPDSTQQGQVIFPGHLPDGVIDAQFSFLRVFVFGRFGVNDSLVIKSIKLRGF